MALGFQTAQGGGRRSETSPEREERIRQEAAVIAQAREEIAAGQGIDDDALEAWLDELDRDENAPLPVPPAPSPFRR